MTIAHRNYDRRIAGILGIAVLFFAIGYLGGKFHIIGQIRDSFLKSSMALNLDIPLGPPQNVSKAQTYSELNALLNKRLEEQDRESSYWTSLLETTSSSEQQRIVEQLRSKYLRLLHPWPGPKTDLHPRRELWFSKDGVDVYLVQLDTHPGVSITCALLIPQKVASPGPALLLLHGYDGNLQSIVSDFDYHHGFGFQLAKNGFIVLAPLRVASTINTRSTLYIKSLASGWALEAIELQQLVRAVDYFSSLEEVDRERVGVYGISLGGQHALMLGAIDQRLSLVICSGYFADRFAWLLKRESPSAASPPGETMMNFIYPIDNVLFTPSMSFLFDDLNLIALIQPRFFGVESGTKDPRHNSAVAEFEKVSQLYLHVGHPERAAFMSFDGGHEVSVDNVMPFLREWIETAPLD